MSSISAVLIVEDEPILAKNMRRYLQSAGFEVVVAGTGETAMTALESARPDIVLLDYRLPDTNGLELIARIHAIDRRTPIIMITGEGNVQLAVQAMKAGAHDYLAKPVVLKELKLMLEKIVEQARVEGALDYFHQKQAGDSGLDKLLGDSQVMLDLKQQILQLIEAEHNMVDGIPASVLITGETGSGKELPMLSMLLSLALAQSPNVLIIVADDLHVDFVNVYGSGDYRRQPPTPTLDGLAAAGIWQTVELGTVRVRVSPAFMKGGPNAPVLPS